MTPAPISRDLRFEIELDVRLLDAWKVLWTASAFAGFTTSTVGAAMRWSYAQGYVDCLTEPRQGSMYREFGFQIPPRKSPENPRK
jgi:hypothetical protein